MAREITLAGQMLVDTFDVLNIISLPHRKDRRREMANQLRRLGLGFDHPKIEIFDARQFDEAGLFPTAGTRGCYQSHQDVLSSAANRGLRSVLILEDDCDFHPEIETLLPAALGSLRAKEWDIFFASILPGHFRPPHTPLGLVPSDIGFPGLHFYAVAGSAINRAAEFLHQTQSRPPGHPQGGAAHVDGVFSVFRRQSPDLKTYIANPDLGFQRLSRTDIHHLAFYDRLPVFRRVASAARKGLRSMGFKRSLTR